jgi:hypothetical protein
MQPRVKGSIMKPKKKKIAKEMRAEYNFDYSEAVRGKYYKRILEEGANVVILDPDIAKVFINSAAVNNALRSLLQITRRTNRLTKNSNGRAIARRGA